jgi:hypothetical protein
MFDIKKAIISGKVELYRNLIFTNREIFLRNHTFAIFERLSSLCERNLVKKMCLKTQNIFSNKVPISFFVDIFKNFDSEASNESLHCKLAVLIYMGAIKVNLHS